MTIRLFLNAGLIWIVIAVLAIANGAFRENILVPALGHSFALAASGVSLSILVFTVTCISFPLIARNDTRTYFLIGLQWVSMTLIFEFVYGHYVAGQSWGSLLQVFNIMKGDLFIVVLITSLVSPLLVARLRNGA